MAEALRAGLAERVLAIVLTQSRLQALDSSAEHPSPTASRELAEALLRQGLQCLSGASEYLLASQMLQQDGVAAGAEPTLATPLQNLAQAGLASWDPSTDELHPTALLAALMGIFEPAVQGVPASVPR